jgi:pimeloyl-ACP methyl ester carboxylesterase
MNNQLQSKFRLLCFSLIGLLLHCAPVSAQNLQRIEIDKFPLEAIEIGEGKYGVVLVHGAAVNADYFFGKYSSQFGQQLVSKGFRVIGIKWNHPDSVYGMKSIEAAINRLKLQGVEKISLIGHSRGGELIANFYRQNSNVANIDSVIQIDSVDDQALTQSDVKKLFIYSKNSSYSRWQPSAFQKSADPKEKIVIPGSDHNVAKIIERQPDLLDLIAAYLLK